MAKKKCLNCNRELGFFSLPMQIGDGVVCNDCLGAAGLNKLADGLRQHSSESVKEILSTRTKLMRTFTRTKAIDKYLLVDETNKLFIVDGILCHFENLIAFELLQDGKTVTKGGLGRAIAGGVLFGGVGAIVGGLTGRKKSNNICTSLRIRITLKNTFCDTCYIDIISGQEIKTNSFLFEAYTNYAQQCLSSLQLIIDDVQSSREQALASGQSFSVADEVLKLKTLLDQGIITEEEFATKKKELLGI